MTTYIGHTKIRAALERELPPVTLLTGPPSVGKWTLARHLADHHRVALIDRRLHENGINADTARQTISFVATNPHGPFKLVAARLGPTTESALNILLKTLEEPPPTARFILTATGAVLPTVASRAHRFVLGLLSTEDIAQILIQQGMSPTAATKAAPFGRGQIDTALRFASLGDGPRATALNVMKAVASADADLFDRAFRGFDSAARDLLVTWFVETITGQFSVFRATDSFGLNRQPERLVAMLFAVSRLPAAAPRLGVRAALEPYLGAA